MGTELIRVSVKEESDDIPSVPPGFESYASFTLKRVQDSEHDENGNITFSPATSRTSEARSVQKEEKETESDVNYSTKITRSLRRRPWINYGQYDDCFEDESDSPKHDQNYKLYPSLPKGVIRGCPECADCQKVTARWKPEDSHRPELEDAPVFYPTEEEFEDTLTYIASIRPKAEAYGICRIVPPPSWKPVCPLKDQNIWEKSKFATRVQRVDKLQNRISMRKMSKIHNSVRKKRRKCAKMTVDFGPDGGSIPGSADAVYCEAERFGFEPGPEFTLNKFQKYADDFKAQYFARKEIVSDIRGKMSIVQEHWEPSTEQIEGEYWRIVEKATEEIEVLYGADLETGVFGSGFPKKSNPGGSALDEKYIKSGWNLNNFPRLPGSVLSYESSDISGVLVPWLYIGMCLSSFCWHVEDHHLYSLNYMHWGAPKFWYGVPGKDAPKLEEAMRKHLPDLFEEQPDLLHKLVTQLSPSVLKSEGVPVYRCVQKAGEFVLTFPRAYHAGFNCGFNCAEAVNVAPVDWLPHGQHAIELYREQGRKTSLSHDKLLLGAAREAVRAHWELNLLRNNTSSNLRWKDVCGPDGILAKTLKIRVETERVRREFLCKSSKALKMESSFDATSERECSVCFFDLHLSAAGCRCSPDRYACLNHAKQFCSCSWGAKFFLFRYDIAELNILVEALEGKLSAIYRWARLDLGLALSSYVSKDNSLDGRSSNSIEGMHMNEETLRSSSISSREPQGEQSKEKFLVSNGSLTPGIRKPLEAAVATKDSNAPSDSNVAYPVLGVENHNSKSNKVEYAYSASSSRVPVRLFSHELLSNSLQGQDNLILLSDDENDEPKGSGSEIVNEHASKELLEELKKELHSSDEGNPCVSKDDSSLTAINQKNDNLSSKIQKDSSSNLVEVNLEHGQTSTTQSTSDMLNVTRNVSSNAGKVSTHMGSAENDCVKPQTHGIDSRKTDAEGSPEKVTVNASVNLLDSTRSNIGTPSCSQSNMDRNFRQKGPRIAKLVRRISCNVEPLEYGVVLSGKAWCSSQVIFPKGFRSRVRYISVLDPSNTAYYVSEILHAGKDRPLFMVHLENCPSEVFIHVSAARSWEMVRERVNQEIAKQHRQGQKNLPPLQPPGSLDGFEMFGFSSPAIVQAIEALDRNRVCTEYWEARPYSRPQVQIPQNFQPLKNSGNLNKSPEEEAAKRIPGSNLLLLRNLFKKANPEELHSLCSILGENRQTIDFGVVNRLLNEEVQSRSR